jgi:hypothetical protein
MNAYLTTLPLGKVADVSVSTTSNTPPLYCGVVIYQKEV